MGSGAFAVPSLTAISESHHEILLVVSQPDKPAGRGRKVTPPPLAERAKALSLPLFQPDDLKASSTVEKIKDLNADIIVVVAYGKILPKEILDIPPKGCVNLHASLLPKYRGPAPINWAIINGETETGVTTMFINERMDAGDIILQSSIPIKETDTTVTLHNILAPLGAELLFKTLDQIEKGNATSKPQDEKDATYAPMLKKEDGKIDWNKGARQIFNRIRGLVPWPSAYTILDGKLLHIYDSSVIEAASEAPAGTVVAVNDAVVVSTGEGKLCLKEVQLEGRKRMKIKDFLNGHKIRPGTRLG